MTVWNCRVCGLGYDESPWGADDRTPDFTFCECCGAEFGFNDYIPGVVRYFRAGWLERGAPWHYPHFRPDNWDLSAQLRLIPKRYR